MRRSLVRIAITLIAANAALAIVILLGGDMGETGGRILGTSLLATATALLLGDSQRRLAGVSLVDTILRGIQRRLDFRVFIEQ